MQINNSEKIKILDFIATCDDFSKGKFLLVDSKVNNILKKIGESDELYNLFNDVLVNYNFEKEFSHAQIKFVGKPPKFEVPTEPFKLLPLVFCILVKIQDKSLDFSEFLKTYFNGDTEGLSGFANQLIIPFKNIISSIFEITRDDNLNVNKLYVEAKTSMVEPREEIKEEKIVEEKDLSVYFIEMQKLINDMLTEIDYNIRLKKSIKEDAYIILDAMLEACQLENLKLLNGLIVGFEFIAPSIKDIKFLYKELKKVLLDLYDNM